MADRWRQPATIVAVENSNHGLVMFDGQVERAPVDVTVDPETFARMRLGQVCLRCWEPQETAMPFACSLCGYGIRDYQTRDLGREFEGYKHIGPTTTVDDEIEALRERKARSSDSSIWVPGDAA